jgi:hypothetical protein
MTSPSVVNSVPWHRTVNENLHTQPVTHNLQAATTIAQLSESLGDSAVPGPSSRKRQKRTLLTTIEPQAQQQQQSTQLNTAGMDQCQLRVDGTGQWDHLLERWKQTDQTIVDFKNLAADDDDDEYYEEEEQDGPGEAVDEDPREMSDGGNDVEKEQKRSKMNGDQIVDIINERIEHFTAIWKPNKGVLKGDEVDYDPEAMLEEAEASNLRQRLIETYETDTAYYRQRLDKLCDEIVKFPGRSADVVRYQCRNLELTVDYIELSKWLLSIYQFNPVDNDIEEEERPEVSMGDRTQLSAEVIDLGTPPESSPQSGGKEEVSVNSSPPLAALAGGIQEQHYSPARRSHSVDSVIADTVEYMADVVLTVAARPQVQFSDPPENASISSARRWLWAELIAKKDRKRIVTKALQEMKKKDRETIRDRLTTVGKPGMIREIPACIQMMAKNKAKMPGVLVRDMQKIIIFTRLFLCWWLCDNYFLVEPSKWHLEALGRCLQGGSPDPSTFCDYLSKIMTTTFSPSALESPDAPSQAEIIEISDDDEPLPLPSASSNDKRKSGI